MDVSHAPDRLCYLEAAQIRGPVANFDHVGLKDRDDHDIGRLDGIIIDAAARRMQYFVVEQGFLRRRRYLLPIVQTEVDTADNVLRMDVGRDDLSDCTPFDPESYRRYSDEDLLAGMFHGYHTDADDRA